jgi:hypothetical protein
MNNTIGSMTTCLPLNCFGFHLVATANCILFDPKMQVMCLYITGHLNTVFPAEYQKEILRYLYYHQVHILGSFTY